MVPLLGQRGRQSSSERLIRGGKDSAGRSGQPLAGDRDTEDFVLMQGRRAGERRKKKSDLAKCEQLAVFKRAPASTGAAAFYSEKIGGQRK